MHQRARLTTAFQRAAKAAGELISIEDLERHFSSSNAANSALKFVCEESSCGVPVFAVITATAKPGRKSSPASYFRAGASQKHVCDKLVVATEHDGQTGGGTIPASPQRTTAPTKWVDPRTVSDTGSGGSGSGLVTTDDPDANGSGRGRQTSGNATSQGSSQRVEVFAKQWQAQTPYERQSTALLAPWNPGATYDSAFHAVPSWPPAGNVRDLRTVHDKIMLATVRAVVVYGTGYTIELLQLNTDGRALSLWIPDTCLAYGAAGKALRQQIVAASQSPAQLIGHTVFALGTFTDKRIKGAAVLSLTVEHPHLLWIA